MKFTFIETQKIVSKKDQSTYLSFLIKEIRIDTETNELIAHTHNRKAFDLLSNKLSIYNKLQGIEGVMNLRFSSTPNVDEFKIIFKDDIIGSLEFLEQFKAISKKTYDDATAELILNANKPSTTIVSRTPS